LTDIVARGKTGDVTFDGASIQVRKGGYVAFLGGGFASEKRVALADVVGVQYQEPSRMRDGFIRFLTTGMRPLTSSFGINVVRKALSDPDAVLFSAAQTGDFSALHTAVEEVLQSQLGR
jgi:Domain of unknown function (DUF4429)